MNNNKKKWKPWYWIVVVILILAFTSGSSSFITKRYFEGEIEKKDSIINASKKRSDSLLELYAESEERIKQMDSEIETLEILNRQTDVQIRWKERVIYRSRDTSYITNARRISDSANRFYQRADNLR